MPPRARRDSFGELFRRLPTGILILNLKTNYMRKFFLLLCMFCLEISLLAQTKQVTGKVTDENGLPLSSISVHVKNSRVGISTKIDGTFSLNVPENATLVFTGVGYLPKEI